MKHFNLKMIGAIVFLSTTIPSFSQNNWTINGNFNTTGATNFLGTTNNEPLSIKTNGTQRVYINAFSGGTTGFVGIGNGFSTPTSLLHINGIPNGTGNVFETDAPNGVNTFWTMNRNGLEIGSLFALFNNDFRIQAAQPTAKILLNTAAPRVEFVNAYVLCKVLVLAVQPM